MYDTQVVIDGVICRIVVRGPRNGLYKCVFHRDQATIDQIDQINWEKPTVEGKCLLPVGFGYRVEEISYSMSTRSYTVLLQVLEQYLGDITEVDDRIDDILGTGEIK